jgi:hypothetical protein
LQKEEKKSEERKERGRKRKEVCSGCEIAV